MFCGQKFESFFHFGFSKLETWATCSCSISQIVCYNCGMSRARTNWAKSPWEAKSRWNSQSVCLLWLNESAFWVFWWEIPNKKHRKTVKQPQVILEGIICHFRMGCAERWGRAADSVRILLGRAEGFAWHWDVPCFDFFQFALNWEQEAATFQCERGKTRQK